MTTNQKVSQQNLNLVVVVTMMFMFAMISFVTNMAAPFGQIWGFKYEWSGMLGNLMNFAAYLFMGIPAGRLLMTIGYKKTALLALAVGFIGLGVQYLSSIVGADAVVMSVKDIPVTLNLFIYLLGAFICGFCVCMLNTVVNPMLNLLGGGGNRGNQLLQIGASLNSLAGAFTPMLVGMMIGTVTKNTMMSNVAPLLWAGMAIFAISFIIISCITMPEPALERARAEKAAGKVKAKSQYSAWSFRHFVLGAVAIFFYVGTEVGIPSELMFYLSDASERGAGILINGAAIGGAIAFVYWILMLVGRMSSSVISGRVSTRTQMLTVSGVACILVLVAIFTPKSVGIDVPKFVYNPESKTHAILQEVGMPDPSIDIFIQDPANFDWSTEPTSAAALESDKSIAVEDAAKLMETPKVPLSALFLVLCGLCTSLMWGGIFNLCTEGLGRFTEQASGIFMMLVVGGGIMPFIQHSILQPSIGYMASYWLVVGMLIYIFYYSLAGCKNVNKNIPTGPEENI